jgi:predicted O-methyltransferase YrrM
MRSSYIQNNYGNVFLSLILAKMPQICVECGILDGYSTISIAKGLKFNSEKLGIHGLLYSYDLWDEYEFKSGKREDVDAILRKENLDKYVILKSGDALEVHTNYYEHYVEFLHIDISNDGDKIERVLDFWPPKMADNSIIAIEGGSEERDKVEWMIKYNKKPIKPSLEHCNFNYFTFQEFPSLTLIFIGD